MRPNTTAQSLDGVNRRTGGAECGGGGRRLTSCVMEGWRQQPALEGDEEAHVGCVFEHVTMCDCDHGNVTSLCTVGVNAPVGFASKLGACRRYARN